MNLLNEFISNFNFYIIVFLIFTFFISGLIKGFLGLGLPSSAMGLLTFVIEPVHAISVMVAPIIFTNIAQFVRAPNPKKTMNEFKFFAIFIIISIFCTSLFITVYPTQVLTLAIGCAMVAFSLNQLYGVKVSIGPSYFWHIVVGIISGVLGGLSSIWSPPVAMYLIARNYGKEQFISATGFLFMVGGLPLGLGLYFAGVLTYLVILQSLMALIFVLIGFRIGESLRNFVSQKIFRNCVLVSFLIMGSRLIYEGLF
jgi:uncharacterized membrane protein YfcA